MQIHSVGIDLGKTTFHLVALGTAGEVLTSKPERIAEDHAAINTVVPDDFSGKS